MNTEAVIEAETENERITMPAVNLLDRVLVSSSLPFHDPLPGLVISVSDGSVDVMLFSSGNIVPYEDCIHINDPRLESDPDIINRFAYRGVYKLADAEIVAADLSRRIIDFSERMENIEATLAEQAKQLVSLQRASKAKKPGRPPGRPKQEIAEPKQEVVEMDK